jgi:hypothetical protein
MKQLKWIGSGSIIILTSLVTAFNYQTVLVDLNQQNRCLEKLIKYGGVLKIQIIHKN